MSLYLCSDGDALRLLLRDRAEPLTWLTAEPTFATRAENSWPRICGLVAPVKTCGSIGVTIGPAMYS